MGGLSSFEQKPLCLEDGEALELVVAFKCMSPTCGILIVNQNSKQSCLNLFKRIEHIKGVSIFLLDNGCEESERFSKELHVLKSPVLYRRTSEVKSLPAAYNILFQMVKKADVEWVWILPMESFDLDSIEGVWPQSMESNEFGAEIRSGVFGPSPLLLQRSMINIIFPQALLKNGLSFVEEYFTGAYVWWDLVWQIKRFGLQPTMLYSFDGNKENRDLKRLQWLFVGRNPFLFIHLRSRGLVERVVYSFLHLVPILLSLWYSRSKKKNMTHLFKGIRDGWEIIF